MTKPLAERTDPEVAPCDEPSFRSFVEPHWASMERLARNLSAPHAWEDVLQDALITAWRKRAQFDANRGSSRNWLLAIVADKAGKARRGQSRRARAESGLPATTHTRGGSPTEDLDLRQAVTRLARRQRTAVVLHYYLGLPTAEIAQLMGCSAGTVKSTLVDARRRIKSLLGEDFR